MGQKARKVVINLAKPPAPYFNKVRSAFDFEFACNI
jgi:hypothetical protein